MTDSRPVHIAAGRDARLAALRSYNILDTPREKAFDDVVEAASAFCGVPIALVSLVDADRQWFKACVGLNASQTPVDQAVCAIAIQQPDPLIIPDLALDPRTADNPLVNEDPKIRFYAGAPLVTRSGHALGTLCVIDTAPRADGLTADQTRGLVALARQVTHLIEMRSAVEERDASITAHLAFGDEAAARALLSDEARSLAEARDERSSAAQEAGRIGTFDLDVQADVAVVSPQFCRIFGLPEAAAYPVAVIEANVVATEQAAHSIPALRIDGSAQLDVEYRIMRPSDGEIRWIARRARFVRENGRAVRLIGTVHDVTERRLAGQRVDAMLELGDSLREADDIPAVVSIAAGILGRELGADRTGYATVHTANGTFQIAQDWTSGSVLSLSGAHPLAPFSHTLKRLAAGEPMAIANVRSAAWLEDEREAYGAIGVQAVINVPVIARGRLAGLFFVHTAGPRVWDEKAIEFVQGVADRTYATIAQFEAEEQRNLLNLELSHRMKNMLAMVQAIANQTLKSVDDRLAVAALDQRLMALSSAHDVLLQDHWVAARVRTVIERVLAPLGVLDRFRVEGPATTFGPRASLTLSLLLNELSTNAIKYGALSVDDGHVALTWSVDGIGADAVFRLSWRELGGPPASEPTRTGFGSRLIKMGLLGTGGTSTRYLLSGFEADFSISLDRANAE